VKGFVLGALFVLAALLAGAALLWFQAPQYLPQSLRVRNPHSSDYAPNVYRWRDDAGVTQLTDSPPADGRAYEVVRIRADTNLMPARTAAD
jgi:hypothetical protein